MSRKVGDKKISVICGCYHRLKEGISIENAVWGICTKFIYSTIARTQILGRIRRTSKNEAITNHVGLVNALAFTPMGGMVLPVEATMYGGKGEFKVTGMVGQSMDESVNVAYSFIKSNAKEFKVDEKLFTTKDVHIHLLEGAIKKDGPSAGCSIVTSLLSLFLDKEIPQTVAMTGEISLRGDILKIGGLKEKIIGAYNDGVKKIFIPYTNSCDLEEIPEVVKEKVKIILVKNYKEIFNALFK